MANGQFGYFASDAAEKIGIANDTLRSWSLRLEKEGVEFERDGKKRKYHDSDIEGFKKFKFIVDRTKSLEKAVEQTKPLFSTEKRTSVTEKTVSVFEESEEKQEYITMSKDDFNDTMRELAEQVAEHTAQKVMDKTEKRDRELMQRLEQSQQRMLEQKQEENEKKGFFKRLFG